MSKRNQKRRRQHKRDEARIEAASEAAYNETLRRCTSVEEFLQQQNRTLLSRISDVAEAVRRSQVRFLEDCSRRLQRLSTRLSADGCWQFLVANLERARAFGVEDDFRHLVFLAAGHFADARMLKTVRSYRRDR